MRLKHPWAILSMGTTGREASTRQAPSSSFHKASRPVSSSSWSHLRVLMSPLTDFGRLQERPSFAVSLGLLTQPLLFGIPGSVEG